jgi:hypothetical protein
MNNNKPDIEQFTNLDLKGVVFNPEVHEAAKSMMGIYLGFLEVAKEKTNNDDDAMFLAGQAFSAWVRGSINNN